MRSRYQEMPDFMPSRDQDPATDTWGSPKQRSVKDLIAKFNAISKINFEDKKQNKQELMVESHKKRLGAIQKNPNMKSESASAIKTTGKCPKCTLENERNPLTKPEAAKEPPEAYSLKPQSNGIKSYELLGAKPKTKAEDSENFELMHPKDLETIYSGGDSNSPAKAYAEAYANLARNDELSVFSNMFKGVGELKHKNHKDTIEINRLLRRLESSIAKGELVEASIYANELAELLINCLMVRQKSQSPTKKQGSTNISAVCDRVGWKEPKRTSLNETRAPQPVARKDETYRQLMNLDNADLVGNAKDFECLVCFLDVAAGEGVTLRECLHQFCRPCLANTIEYNKDAEVKCPFRDDQYSCNIALQDREIKALVRPQVYEEHLAKSVAEAESKIGDKAFHCKTPDCKGWCIFEDNVNEFRCPVCRRINCLICRAIHSEMNCEQYQEKTDADESGDARRTKDMLEEMVRKGEALTCPTCQVILMKKLGCDWVRCSMCKTEICWVTRGPRWGPQGKGDTSGGCQCGVNGVKCHPQCSYCH